MRTLTLKDLPDPLGFETLKTAIRVQNNSKPTVDTEACPDCGSDKLHTQTEARGGGYSETVTYCADCGTTLT